MQAWLIATELKESLGHQVETFAWKLNSDWLRGHVGLPLYAQQYSIFCKLFM